ncbi:hypothetical protein ALQ48_04481 [Pseudomonas coronafaciens pv. zizaniae]|nr:hypothetical protein ALQ48_04481 [Pseudomonas coronafaciens pv. zizaniae]
MVFSLKAGCPTGFCRFISLDPFKACPEAYASLNAPSDAFRIGTMPEKQLFHE